MTVALLTHPDCLRHDPGPGHPECPDRLRAVMAALGHPDFAPLLREEAPEATAEQLSRPHPSAYVEAILALRPGPAGVSLDADTRLVEGSVAAARRAAGGACAAVDAVMEGRARRAFVAVRPPGHHAEPATPMGFCVFNNVAVAALHARARWGLRRIAVVDFDVHHGNGTQAMFEGDPALFYASSHQMPLFPGTGEADERGVAGNVANAPLPPGADGGVFRAAWERVLLPALDGFAPELLLVSAGFDAHRADPLAQVRCGAEDFGWLTGRLVEAAERLCGGRLVSVLEGGYDLRALGECVGVHVRGLMEG